MNKKNLDIVYFVLHYSTIQKNNKMGMTAFKCVTLCIIQTFIATSLTCCCNKGMKVNDAVDVEDECTIHAEMQYYDFDKIRDLSLFFDSILQEHPIPCWKAEGYDSFLDGLSNCVGRVDDFRNGRTPCFPDSLVSHYIGRLGHECAIVGLHTSDVDLTYPEWFLMLAAYYSPDITCLVELKTPNHKAGVLNFASRDYFMPSWPYLFLKRDKGFEVRSILIGEAKIHEISQIVDDSGELYYLCSNNLPYQSFMQVLYWAKSDNEVTLVAQCDSLPADEGVEFEQCYYDPAKRAWFCCNVDKETDTLIPISEKPSLILKLDKERSEFVHDSFQ